MHPNIYISTGAFRENKLSRILSLAAENGIHNLELGSKVAYTPDNLNLVFKYNNPLHFLLHNYFPVPQNDFVLNLASDDSQVFKCSMDHCKQAVDISAKIGSPFYSVHSGFAFHAAPCDLDHKQSDLPRIPYDKAYRIFVNAVTELADYAVKKKVKLAVENNVVTKFNLTGGKNEIMLLAEAEETLDFYKAVSSDNIFFLIDLGHLKVTSKSLKFSIVAYLDAVLPYAIAFHLSDNDSSSDQHLPFDENVWFKDLIKKGPSRFFIIESRNLEFSKMIHCYHCLEKMLN